MGVRPKDSDPGDAGAEVTDLWPVTIRVDAPSFQEPTALVEWYHDLAPGLRVRFDVRLRHDAHPARMLTETKRDRSTGVVTSCKRVGFQPAPWFVQASADSMRVNYSGGGCTDPGSVLIYWPDGALQPGTIPEQWRGLKQ